MKQRAPRVSVNNLNQKEIYSRNYSRGLVCETLADHAIHAFKCVDMNFDYFSINLFISFALW